MLKARWNTGRMYTARGQNIEAALVGGRIFFNDEDRGIEGSVDVSDVLDFITKESELRDWVMGAYDGGHYKNELLGTLKRVTEKETA